MAMSLWETYYLTTANRLIEVNLAAGVPARAEFLQALALWGDQEVRIYPGQVTPSGDLTRTAIYGPTPLPTGEAALVTTVIFMEESIVIPPEAKQPLRPESWVLGAVAVLAVGGGIWWWSRRREAAVMGMFMDPPPPSNRCCPSGARMLASGTCQDTTTKRFVKSIPCAQRMAPRRMMKVGMEPVPTYPPPVRIGGWI